MGRWGGAGAMGRRRGAGLLLLLSGAQAHVSLLWPPARAPGLDFLDSLRTEGDCGAPPGQARTSLRSGSPVNISWSLAYAHGGGYRLTLVSPGGKGEELALQLLPAAPGEWQTGERFSRSHVVTLPQGVQCDDCYLKLERQATEWGKNYIFRSCADVVVSSTAEEKCVEGSREGERCTCPRGRAGERCQYTVDCSSDMDCNGPKGRGKCIVTDTTVYREGRCFCAPGWQGEQCDSRSRWSPEEARRYTEEDYQKAVLGEGVELLWRRLEEEGEVELILSAPTTSWVGLGWRPSSTTAACHSFPSSLPPPKWDFHAMDCTDMVVGAAREGRGRVGDYYTRDRSTPLPDSYYGGEDDLASYHAWEEDGKTTLRVVRSSGGGVADHALEGELHVIWAHGQQAPYYGPDQLKYHGKNSRGVTVVDFGSSSTGFPPLQVGLGVSCLLLVLLLALQVAQNFDRKLSCLNPASYRAFN